MRQLHFFVPALNIPDQAAATAAGWTVAEGGRERDAEEGGSSPADRDTLTALLLPSSLLPIGRGKLLP